MKRNTIHRSWSYALIITFMVFGLMSCEEEERDTNFINEIGLPANIDLIVRVSQDNTGTVSFTPSGDNSSSFSIDFGDGSGEEGIALPGESISHIYPEGNFTVTVTGRNLNGDTASITREVMVSFRPPENLEVTITSVIGDNFSVNLSATADFAVGFDVFWGDVADEEPTPLMIGESVQHTYPDVGTYEVRVVALSGGSETIEVIETVVIIDPLTLPIDFESETIDYVFIDFGGAVTTVIDNPDPSGVNTSNRVAQFFKETGAQDFAGTVIDVGAPLDFSDFTAFTMDVWSPDPAITVLLKLENADDPNIAAEVQATTTAVNAWETLTFDFSNADLSQEYSKIVVFLDFGNPGVGTTYYFDNIAQAGGGGSSDPVELPVDFENPDLDYVVFGFEGAESDIIPNPDPSGINTSGNVVRTIKTVGAQFFAGTIVELDVPIDFSSSEKLSLKTWSPKVNIPVRIKLENSDGSQFVELDVNTTVGSQWEELVWDFTGQTAGSSFTKVVIFFEFVDGLPGDGTTYYFDDIQLAD